MNRHNAEEEILDPSLPLLFVANGYLYRGDDAFGPWFVSKSDLTYRNRYWKGAFILDASGVKSFIGGFGAAPPKNKLIRTLGKFASWTSAKPIIEKRQKLSLEEFKAEILSAIANRDQYDLDYKIFDQAVKPLSEAQSYSEAIECLPNRL